MKKSVRIALLLSILLAFVLPQTVYARGLHEDKIVFGGTYRLASGDTLDGSLVVFGGVADLETDSVVQGDVVLFGGSLSSGGLIQGNLVGLGGFVNLADGAVVEGNVVLPGAHLEKAEGARIEGEIIDPADDQLALNLPGGVRIPQVDVRVSPLMESLYAGVGFFFRTFAWAALAVLLLLFIPNPTRRISRAAVDQPLIAGGLGLLTVVVLPFAAVILAITILLIPASLLLLLVAGLAWVLGVVALGYEVGERIARQANQQWAPAVSAGLGTFILIFVTNGLAQVISCIGWVFPFLIGIVGLGAVLLTGFGTQSYPLVASYASSTGAEPPASVQAQENLNASGRPSGTQAGSAIEPVSENSEDQGAFAESDDTGAGEATQPEDENES